MYETYTGRRTRAWESLLAEEGDSLPADVRAHYDTLLTAMPVLWERYWGPRFAARSASL